MLANAGAGLLAELVSPWGFHTRAVHEQLQPGGTCWNLWRMSPVWGRERVWGAQRQCVRNWAQPPLLCCWWGGGRENCEWSRAWEKGLLWVIKPFPHVNLFCWWVISPFSYQPFDIFSLCFPAEKGNDRPASMGTWCQPTSSRKILKNFQHSLALNSFYCLF